MATSTIRYCHHLPPSAHSRPSAATARMRYTSSTANEPIVAERMKVANWSLGKNGTNFPSGPRETRTASRSSSPRRARSTRSPPTATIRFADPRACRSATSSANTCGSSPSRPSAKNPRPMSDADRERQGHRVEDDDELEQCRVPLADVLRRHLGDRRRARRPRLPRRRPPCRTRSRRRHAMKTKNAPAAADRPQHGARDRAVRVGGLLADRRRRLEPDEEQDAEEHAAEHAAARDAEERCLTGVEHREREAVLAALGDDHDRQGAASGRTTAARTSASPRPRSGRRCS